MMSGGVGCVRSFRDFCLTIERKDREHDCSLEAVEYSFQLVKLEYFGFLDDQKVTTCFPNSSQDN